MTKKNIEIRVYDDNPQKIRINKLKPIRIIILSILLIVIIVFFIFSKDIIKSINQNINTVNRLNTKIKLSTNKLSKLKNEYRKIKHKTLLLDSLNRQTKQQDSILIPDFKSLNNSINFNQLHYSTNIDSLLNISKKRLKNFSFLANNFNKNDDVIKHYPSKYPVKNIIIIRKYKKYLDPMTGNLKFHRGIDFGGKIGEIVMSTAEGVVVKEGTDKYFGKFIEIKHNDSISSFYAHLNSISVKKNQKIGKGEEIGFLGNSGVSTSYHLHFEIRINDSAVNPMDYIIHNK